MFLLDRLLRRAIVDGELTVTDPRGRVRRYGRPSASLRPVAARLADTATANAIARNPALGAGEAWVDGRLTFEEGDILDLLNLVTFNTRWDKDNPTRVALWRQQAIAAKLDQINFARRSRRNVAHHYDLSDRLYDLFLDADRQYSCAYFTDPANSLEAAQADKKAHIAAKLALAPGQKVLDIGCGWGGMALYLNRVAGVEVLGVTLSEEQLKVARGRAEAAGVAGKVRFELIDYRAVRGPFDRIVSVGMFEHVGVNHYRAFFDKAATLLKPDGVMVLHAIGRFGPPVATNAFIRKHIFPGGYIPALSEVLPAIEKSGLMTTDIEILRLHYAETLKAWRERFMANRDRAKEIYDERFCRMWEFYLAGSEAAFRWQDLMVFQIQLARKNDTLPITRNYIANCERAVAMVDEPTASSPKRRARRSRAGKLTPS